MTMCGRFTLAKTPKQIREDFPELPAPARLAPRYNIAPTQAVCAWMADPAPRMEIFSWGLIPHWARDPSIGAKLINARAETLLEKPSFKQAFRRKRCLIPADGWYEWQTAPNKKKQPMYFHRSDGRCFAFAGLWDEWHDKSGGMILSCTVITTRPNALTRRIHPRMPAILREEDHSAWLKSEENDLSLLSRMLEPVAADGFTVHPVSPAVNRATAEGPDLVLPVTLPPAGPIQTELF